MGHKPGMPCPGPSSAWPRRRGACGGRQQLQHGLVEAVGRFIGHPVAGIFDQANLELAMVPAQDFEAGIERAAGDDVLGTPNGLHAGRNLAKRPSEPIGCRKGTATKARALDVFGLQMNGERIDVSGIGKH